MSTMETLDKINFRSVDPEGMIDLVVCIPDMLSEAYDASRHFTLPPFYVNAKKIVIAGMGGSGIAGDVMKSLLLEESNVVVESIHGYTLPAFVDKDTLVIANSYSGNTEETLAAFISAYERGAKLVAITKGGKLETLAQKYNAPLFKFNFDGQPRASFPFNFIMLASVFEKLGYVNLGVLEKIVPNLKLQTHQYLPEVSTFGNPAKAMARQLYGKLPVIYASENLFPAALRFKAQINENAKSFAFCEALPEINHNSIAGYSNPKLPVQVIDFESNFDNDRIRLRHTLTLTILSKNKIPAERIIFTNIEDRLQELLLAIMFGDYVSCYLAILNKVKPADNHMIDFLKEKLH